MHQPARQVIKELKTLTALRSRIINAIKQPRGGPLKSSLQEGQQFLDKTLQKKMQQCCQHSLKALDQDLARVNEQLDQIVASDEELNRLFNRAADRLITSIEGIGAVTAREVLITTNERPPLRFKNFTEPKRYVPAGNRCYVGVAPFHHRSGTSVRGKTRVSHLANKDVKTLLHMAALSAIHNCEEIKNYYQRKVAEAVPRRDKNKMSVINAVRNNRTADAACITNFCCSEK